MRLTRISDLRRQELRQAAFAVLQREGIAGATLEKVAAEAGASKGIVLHYFRSKHDLFEHSMREANAALRDLVVARLNAAKTPHERLEAVIAGNFDPDFFQSSICHAWVSFCDEASRDAKFARIQRVIHARMHSNLMSALVDLVEPEQAENIALGTSALIDGLWLRHGLHRNGMTGEEAMQQVRTYIAARLALAESSIHREERELVASTA